MMASNKESTQTIHREAVGPDYVSKNRKPEATVSTAVSFPNVHVLAQTPQLIALLTQVQTLPTPSRIPMLTVPALKDDQRCEHRPS